MSRNTTAGWNSEEVYWAVYDDEFFVGFNTNLAGSPYLGADSGVSVAERSYVGQGNQWTIINDEDWAIRVQAQQLIGGVPSGPIVVLNRDRKAVETKSANQVKSLIR